MSRHAWTFAAALTLPATPRRYPTSETGIYLHQHDHDWYEVASHTWPSGKTEPVFRCRVCTDLICCNATSEPPRRFR